MGNQLAAKIRGADMSNRFGKKCSSSMNESQALATVQDLKKYLLSRGIWYRYEEYMEDSLKFIRIEASIKVRP